VNNKKKRNKRRQTKGIIMRTGVRLSSFVFYHQEPSKGEVKIGESSQSSIAFVTDDDGDPSGKTIEGGVISPVIISYGGPYTKEGNRSMQRKHWVQTQAERKPNKKERKKLTNVLVKDLQPASE
jgi:hypothetical protein